jgi:hypothetical protein
MTLSVATLVPALTPLDERILAALSPLRRPRRHAGPASTREVVRRLYPVSVRSSGATEDQAREVAEVLRGLERIERVHTRDGKWRLGPPAVRTPTARRR